MSRKKGSGRKPKLKVADVEEALRTTRGVYSLAAHALGVDRSTISRYVDRHEKLQKVCDEVINTTLDTCEVKVFELIQNGHWPAIKQYMEWKGQDRGYGVNRVEVAGPKGGPIPVEDRIDLSQLSADEQSWLRKILERSVAESAQGAD